ncbi:TlpA family protein disulfide reductase [Egibacter rhizosphaerae]|uniref:TlpA family protein disulfide reductase n=1 Tax=Egibacter rhizosphaerae TaxID=1670831 RepID=A0A411YGC3_9ACTN|nr:TlpA disulfide reductase family protein [Egibacter rhizosphaerae]QBI20335.1 TlpA family protein disulfide reductase [Egibacter rhizosphaerae]
MTAAGAAGRGSASAEEPEAALDERRGSGVDEPPPGISDPPPEAATRRTLLLGLAATAAVLVAAGALAVAGASDPDDAAVPERIGEEPDGPVDEVGSAPGEQAPDDIPTVEPGEQPDVVEELDEDLVPDEAMPLPREELEAFADGPPVDLADMVGEPLVVNFWASWCGPCADEMPELQAVSESRDDVQVLGVNLEDREDDARETVQETGVTYPLAADPQGELFQAVQGFGMPTTLFVDLDGVVRYHHTGPLEAGQIEDLVDEHLEPVNG